MESDSTLPALALAISILAFAFSELGATSIAGRIQAVASSVLNEEAGQSEQFRLLSSLPGGPTAGLRLLNLIALAATMVSMTAVSLDFLGREMGPDLDWGQSQFLLVLAGVTYVTRSLGMRYSAQLCTFMPRLAWLLSFPLRPILLVEDLIVRNPSALRFPARQTLLSTLRSLLTRQRKCWTSTK